MWNEVDSHFSEDRFRISFKTEETTEFIFKKLLETGKNILHFEDYKREGNDVTFNTLNEEQKTYLLDVLEDLGVSVIKEHKYKFGSVKK